MIRINLIPGHKKSALGRAGASQSKAAVYLAVMAGGWLCIGAGAYWILDSTEQETQQLKRKTAENRKRSEEIRKLIDEEALLARQKKVEDVRNAITSVQKQRRSPVYVMFELAKVLSTGKMPDINEEKQRRLENSDPQSRLNTTWDASTVWLKSLEVRGEDTLHLSGAAVDPADLDEFLKRMRSSVRFGYVSHPKFDASSGRYRGKSGQRTYNFNFNAGIAFWD